MLCPTRTIRSSAASDPSGSSFRRRSARFCRRRWAEYGIGSPVEYPKVQNWYRPPIAGSSSSVAIIRCHDEGLEPQPVDEQDRDLALRVGGQQRQPGGLVAKQVCQRGRGARGRVDLRLGACGERKEREQDEDGGWSLRHVTHSVPSCEEAVLEE